MRISERITVSEKFLADFEAVCTRYNLTAEEREEAKQAARRDLENAQVCFAALAREAV